MRFSSRFRCCAQWLLMDWMGFAVYLSSSSRAWKSAARAGILDGFVSTPSL